MEPLDWQRVAEAIRSRRVALGLSQRAAEGVSPATWTKLENAQQQSYKPFVLANVERVLQWPFGTIQDIAIGQSPPEDERAEGSAPLEERVRSMEERLEQLEERVKPKTRRSRSTTGPR